MRKIALPLGAVLALGLAAPAGATHGLPHTPTYKAESDYFHCGGSTKVGNASLVESGAASWNTIKPTASVQSGAGCGFADAGPSSGTNQENVYDAVFKGYFTGNLKTLTVNAHVLYTSIGRPSTADMVVGVRMTLDDVPITGGSGTATGMKSVTVKPVVSSSGASALLQFSVDVSKLKIVDDEDGDGTTERSIGLTLSVPADVLTPFVYDTSETPSGIDFNPATLAAAKIVLT